MRAVRAVIVSVAVCLCVSGPLAPQAAPESRLSGLLREAKTQKPVPGVMILLFDTQNALLDYTYTGANGAFQLRAPSAAGKYRLEGSHIKPLDFAYDPRKPPAPLLLTAYSSSGWTEAGKFVLNKLDAVLGIILGLVIGYAFSVLTKKRQDRRQFKFQVSGLIYHRNDISGTWAEIRTLLGKVAGLDFNTGEQKAKLAKDYQKLLDKLQTQLKDFQSKKLDPSVIYSVRSEDGLTENHEIETAVAKLVKFASGSATLPPLEWAEAEAAFERLANSPLLKDSK